MSFFKFKIVLKSDRSEKSIKSANLSSYVLIMILGNDRRRERSSIYYSATEKNILQNTSWRIGQAYTIIIRAGGISFIMITKQGSLSIIKTISKIEGCTLQTGPYARILCRQDNDYSAQEENLGEGFRRGRGRKLLLNNTDRRTLRS